MNAIMCLLITIALSTVTAFPSGTSIHRPRHYHPYPELDAPPVEAPEAPEAPGTSYADLPRETLESIARHMDDRALDAFGRVHREARLLALRELEQRFQALVHRKWGAFPETMWYRAGAMLCNRAQPPSIQQFRHVLRQQPALTPIQRDRLAIKCDLNGWMQAVHVLEETMGPVSAQARFLLDNKDAFVDAVRELLLLTTAPMWFGNHPQNYQHLQHQHHDHLNAVQHLLEPAQRLRQHLLIDLQMRLYAPSVSGLDWESGSSAEEEDQEEGDAVQEDSEQVDDSRGELHRDFHALPVAAQHGLVEVVQQLLKEGVNLDATIQSMTIVGRIRLHETAAIHLASHADIVRLLLDAGADINQPTRPHGSTPLMIAVCSFEPERVQMYLEQGADPFVRDREGFTALDLARTLATPYVEESAATIVAMLQDAMDAMLSKGRR